MARPHAFALLLSALPLPVLANAAAAGGPQASALDPAVRAQVEAAALAHAAGLPGQVHVAVGRPASPLPACAQPEAFLPPGSKPWGDLQVAVRCLGGAAWTRFVPVQIQVRVRHAVAAASLPAGHRLLPADVQWVDADLARLPPGVVLDGSALSGAQTLHPLAAGAPVRRDLLRAPPVILQGQTVRVLTQGPGYLLSAEGKAQASVAAGQNVAVRMAGGQLITAVARADGTAERAP